MNQHSTTVLATYCSAAKNDFPGLLPAVTRYQSDRIQWVFAQSQQQKQPFFILSGKLGLLAAHEPIAWYDHLLLPEQVPEHAKRVATQLSEKSVETLVFYARSLTDDPHAKPYCDCITQAAGLAGVALEFRLFP